MCFVALGHPQTRASITYTINLKYQKGSEMHTSEALSRLQNIADTPDNKDVIPLNLLQHLAPNYIEHT